MEIPLNESRAVRQERAVRCARGFPEEGAHSALQDCAHRGDSKRARWKIDRVKIVSRATMSARGSRSRSRGLPRLLFHVLVGHREPSAMKGDNTALRPTEDEKEEAQFGQRDSHGEGRGGGRIPLENGQASLESSRSWIRASLSTGCLENLRTPSERVVRGGIAEESLFYSGCNSNEVSGLASGKKDVKQS